MSEYEKKLEFVKRLYQLSREYDIENFGFVHFEDRSWAEIDECDFHFNAAGELQNATVSL